MWIDSDRAFTAFCDEAAESPQIGIDLEFQGEGRYVPQLCLVQIATPHKIVAVDPFRVNIASL
ncbi:MAG TPA: ribonuclease D, partial [Acidobacteriota bacterium]|nr:ribonuclease D [Acidobacteriota bacterium]